MTPAVDFPELKTGSFDLARHVFVEGLYVKNRHSGVFIHISEHLIL